MGDYRTTSGESHPLPAAERKEKRRKAFIVAAGAAAVLLAAGFAARVERSFAAAGYVMPEVHAAVRPCLSGRVSEIAAISGDAVERGAVLARLDDSEAQARLDESKTKMRQLETELARRIAAVTEEKRLHAERLETAKLRANTAESARTRQEEAASRGQAPAAEAEQAALQHELLKSELAALEKKDFSVYDRELEAMRQELAAQKELLERYAAQAARHEIRAPVAGRVLKYDFEVSDFVTPDKALFEIFGGSRYVLRLRIPERHAARVKPGQRYKAALAAHVGFWRPVFKGKVEALRDVIQSENKFSFRTAYCDFNPGPFAVLPGASAEARIYYGRSSFWSFLLGLD